MVLKKVKLPMVSIVTDTDYTTSGCGAHLRSHGLEPAVGLHPVMDGRPHLFYNLPLPPRLLYRYQVILLGDRGRGVEVGSCMNGLWMRKPVPPSKDCESHCEEY